MKAKIKTFLLAKFNNIPIVEKNIWYNRSCYIKDSLPKVFDENGVYIDINKERLYVLHELKNGMKAYYKIIKTYSKRGGDWLYDTDRYNVDFKLSVIK